jgi:hypothetical protein
LRNILKFLKKEDQEKAVKNYWKGIAAVYAVTGC